MTTNIRLITASMILLGTFMTVGCDKVADTSRTAQSVTMKAFNDTKSSWRKFFTYHEPLPEPLPQTRYCYQMQSDIVCYDSEQPTLTSKLVGYQEGENISWVQPGGGSLGASGGEPVALRPLPKPQPTQTMAQGGYSMNAAPVASGGAFINTGPVPETSGQITVNNLPPGYKPSPSAKDR